MSQQATITVQSGAALRRKMEEMKLALERSEQFRRGESLCPAGRYLASTADGHPGCRCAVEESVITFTGSPASLVDFCFGDYRRCSTWRAEKERIAANRRLPWAQIETYRPRRELVPVAGSDSLVMEGDRSGRDEVARG